MSNPKDFLARQIRTNALIVSGGNWAKDAQGGTPGLLIYTASLAPDFVGSRPNKFHSGSGKYGMVQIYQSEMTPSGGFALANTDGGNLRFAFEKSHLHDSTSRRYTANFLIGSGSRAHNFMTVVTGGVGGRTGDHPRVFILSQSLNGETNTQTDNAVNNPLRMLDVNFFVSGSRGSKAQAGTNGDCGTAVFGGDLVVSGTLYAEKQVMEVDLSSDTALYVSGTGEFKNSVIINHGRGSGEALRVKTNLRDPALLVSGRNVFFHTGTSPGTDAYFIVSGSVGHRTTAGTYGTAVFLGDLHVSGNVSSDNAIGAWVDAGTFVYLADGESIAVGGATQAAADIWLGNDGSAIFNEQGLATGDFRVESDGEDEAIFLDASANTLYVNKGETSFVTIIGSANDEGIRVSAAGVILNEHGHANNDLRVESDNDPYMLHVDSSENTVAIGTNAASSATKLHIGNATNEEKVILMIENESANALDAQITFAKQGTAKHCLGMDDSDSDKFKISTGGDLGAGVSLVDLPAATGGTVVFNEDGADVDFKIEGDNDPNMFVVDASTDSIGINVAAGSHGAKVDILENDASSVGLKVTNNPGKDLAGGDIMQLVSGTLEVFSVGTSEIVIHEDAQSSGANTKSLRVESDTDNYMFYVDGANDGVSIGTNSPSTATKLHIGNSSASSSERVILMIENETNSVLDAQITFAKQGAAVHCLGMDDSDSDKLKISTGGSLGAGVSLVDLPSTAGGVIVFNEGAANIDLRIETQSDQSAFLVDASENLVSIGSSAGQADFKVHTANEDEAIFVDASADEVHINKGNSAVSTYIHNDLGAAIDVTTNAVVVNEGGSAFIDFRVESDTIANAIFVDASKDMVLFQTGAYGGTDVSFYVSGSTDAKGTATRGVAVFNGDVLISGSLYNSGSARIDRAFGNVQVLDTGGSSEGICAANKTQDTFKLKEGTGIGLSINAATDTITLSANIGTASPAFTDRGFQTGHFEPFRGTSIICTSSISFVSGNHIDGTSPVAYDASNVGQDVFFFVSGSQGGSTKSTISNRHGVAVFGGDTVVSGALHAQNNAVFSGSLYLGDHTSDTVKFTGRVNSHVLPSADKTYNLGSATNRWANIYTGDLHLRNERGNWTIYEEPDMLVVVNNLTGKKYKMGLTPLEDDE